MALHPKFAENRLIYFTYHKPLEGNTWTLALGRGRYEGAGLSNVQELYAGNPVADVGFAPGLRQRRADLHHGRRRGPPAGRAGDAIRSSARCCA